MEESANGRREERTSEAMEPMVRPKPDEHMRLLRLTESVAAAHWCDGEAHAACVDVLDDDVVGAVLDVEAVVLVPHLPKPRRCQSSASAPPALSGRIIHVVASQ